MASIMKPSLTTIPQTTWPMPSIQGVSGIPTLLQPSQMHLCLVIDWSCHQKRPPHEDLIRSFTKNLLDWGIRRYVILKFYKFSLKFWFLNEFWYSTSSLCCWSFVSACFYLSSLLAIQCRTNVILWFCTLDDTPCFKHPVDWNLRLGPPGCLKLIWS